MDIFVRSGLVFEVPDNPEDRYQLVHDYLVPFIRQQKIGDALAELKEEREKRKQAGAKLTRALKQQLKVAVAGGLVMTGLAIAAVLLGLEAQRRKKVATLLATEATIRAWNS